MSVTDSSLETAAPQETAVPAVEPPLAVLVAIAAIGPMALNMYMPSMPGIARQFGVDYGLVSLTLSLYLVSIAVAPLVHGPLSDRHGRRPIVFVGLGIFTLGCLICATAQGLPQLILGRIVQATGACAGIVVARAMIIDVYGGDKAGSKLSYVIAVMAIAPMLATPLGAWLEEHATWRIGFLSLIGAAVLIAAFAWLRLPETRKPEDRQSITIGELFDTYRILLATKLFRGYAMQTAFSIAVFFAFLGGAPFVMEEILGHPPTVYGLWFTVAAFLHIGGNWFAGRYTERFGRDRMILWGVMLAAIGTLGLLAVSLLGYLSAEILFGFMGFVAIGNGMSIPNGTAAAVATRPAVAGTASGLSSFLQLTLSATAVWLTGQLQDGADSAVPMAVVMLISALVAALLHIGAMRIRAGQAV